MATCGRCRTWRRAGASGLRVRVLAIMDARTAANAACAPHRILAPGAQAPSPPHHSHPDLSNLCCHRGALGTAHVYALGDLLVAARAKHGSPEGLVRHGAAKIAKAEQRKRSAEGKVDQRRRALVQALELLGVQLRWGPARVGSYMALGAGFLTHAACCACCAVLPQGVSHFPCWSKCPRGSGSSTPPPSDRAARTPCSNSTARAVRPPPLPSHRSDFMCTLNKPAAYLKGGKGAPSVDSMLPYLQLVDWCEKNGANFNGVSGSAQLLLCGWQRLIACACVASACAPLCTCICVRRQGQSKWRN